MSHDELSAACSAAITTDPIQPSARGLGSLVGRILDFAKAHVGVVNQETLTAAALAAWDNTVAALNFPQIPDFAEVPLKAYLRSQIPALIGLLYAGS